jgi:tetratricopeptide (TPR) repeat protein
MKTGYLALLLLAPLTYQAAAAPPGKLGPAAAPDAEKELFAARYDQAAELYSKLLRDDPAWAPGYYGLVRALIGAYRAHEAYAAADEGLQRAPAFAEAQAAAGLAAYRRGDLPRAEAYFRKARQIDPNYAYALSGLASVACATSKFKTCEDLMAQAYRASPDDPQLIVQWADALHGAAQISALERALAIYDPASRETRRLRVRIAVDKAAGDRKLQRLASPYQSYDIELVPIGVDLRRPWGVGLRVRLNDTRTVRLILDTGSSGISISAKAAEKAGLEILSNQRYEVHGIGDKKPQEAVVYLAAAVDIGELRLADFPVGAFTAAKSDAYDGLIGADVFELFQVSIDFPNMRLQLAPWPDGQPAADVAVDASETLPAGFWRAYRFGHTLTIPVSINQGSEQPFVIDSGGWDNLIDTGTAQKSTKVRRDYNSGLRGVQGRVNQVSRASKVSLAFAGFRQDNSDLLAFSLESLGDQVGVGVAGILGMPVLRQMKMTIDYRNGAVRFERTVRR